MKSENATNLLLGIAYTVIIFHILILVKIIPYEITWGGRLKSDQEMYVFETTSIALNALLIWMLRLKEKGAKHKAIDLTLWMFCLLFALNTIGNLFAETMIEKAFSLLTFSFAFLLYKILRPKK